jgi:Tn3 transposase DDE domain
VGGVGDASTTTSRRLAAATTSKGRCSGRSATTAPAPSIRRSSLKAGIVAPSVMLRNLAAYRRQNQLDLALHVLGRIERTLFMLDWLESPELRRRCHAGVSTLGASLDTLAGPTPNQRSFALSVEDRLVIQEMIAEYSYTYDSNDANGLLSCLSKTASSRCLFQATPLPCSCFNRQQQFMNGQSRDWRVATVPSSAGTTKREYCSMN